MKTIHLFIATVVITMLSAAWPAIGAVEISEQGGGYQIKGQTYEAVIHGDGHFRSLVVDGVEFLMVDKHRGKELVGGHFPGDEPAEKVERDGDTIVATRDRITVRYAFDDKGFTIRTDGGAVRWMLSENVTACIAKEGVVPRGAATGDVFRIVAGKAAIAVDQPHHMIYGRTFPSKLTRGTKEQAPFEARWTCGVEVAAAEMVDLAAVKPTGRNPKDTAEYKANETPGVSVDLKSLAGGPARVTVGWTVHDHPHDGEQVATGTSAIELKAGEARTVQFDVPLDKPGLFFTRVRLFGVAADADPTEGKGKPLQSKTLAFIYDGEAYEGEFTRPDDFEQFWDAKLEAMRKIPFDPKLKENKDYAIEGYKGYDLEITGHDGERLKCVLVVPEGEGPFDAEVERLGGDAARVRRQLTKFAKQPAGVGMWERGARRIRVGAALPGDATFRRWDGLNDNNMLACYLQTVRLADYLRSREDVEHIWLYGASRGGPIMLAAAALAPEQIAAVNAHVPTSCGVSWSDRPYRGWGRPPGRDAEGLKTAAYFDPVNFAPDLTVPVVMDAGIYDGLSPAPGMLALRNRASNAPFRVVSIEQGHHGYFQLSDRDKMKAALAEHLKAGGIDPAGDGEAE